MLVCFPRVGTIADQLESEEETSSDAVVKRLARLEEQVTQSAKALQWIMDSLKSQGFGAKEAPSLTLSAADESPNAYASVPEKEDGVHVNARQFHYPGSKITRFPVPEEMVPWEISFSSYKPNYYAPEVSEDQVDGSESGALENYKNPGGRTGISGQGTLSHLGPNLNVDLVLTRDSERFVLEYLAVWGENQAGMVLPGGPVESTVQLPVSLKRTMGKRLYEKLNDKISAAPKVFEGYVDDSRNTDNAWVETTVFNIHLERTSPVLLDINNMVVSSHGLLQWQEVSSKARLSSDQRDYLRKVAELQNRKF